MPYLRLCLVAVKHFSENTYFLEMLISGKGKYFSVFGCISKNFPENISGVWKRRRKTQILKNTSHNLEKKSSTTTGDRDPRSRSMARSCEASIAISDLPLSPSIAILRRRDCDQWRDLAVRRFSSRAHARSLSLSLSLSFSGNALKGK